MATLVKIGGRPFVFGLTWRSLYGNLPIGQRIGVLARELGAKHYVLVDADTGQEQAWAGFMSTSDKNATGARGTLYSPGALFAHAGLARDSAILFGQAAGGHYMVALRGGVPAAGYELWSRDVNDVHKRAQHFIEASGNNALVLFGRMPLLATRPDPVSLELLSGDAELLERARLRSTEKIALWKLMLLPALLAALAVGWQVRAYMQERTEKAMAELRSMQQTPERLYRVSLANEMSKGMVSAKVFYEQLSEALQMPADAGGWLLERMICTPQQCLLKYRRQSGTYASFPDLPGVKQERGQPGEIDTLEVSKAITLTQTLEQSPSWPRESDFLNRFGEQLQQWSGRGFAFRIGATAPWAVPTGLAVSQVPQVQLIKAGEWELSGPLWSLALLAQLPETLCISQMNMTLQGSSGTVQVKGRYLVRADLS